MKKITKTNGIFFYNNSLSGNIIITNDGYISFKTFRCPLKPEKLINKMFKEVKNIAKKFGAQAGFFESHQPKQGIYSGVTIWLHLVDPQKIDRVLEKMKKNFTIYTI